MNPVPFLFNYVKRNLLNPAQATRNYSFLKNAAGDVLSRAIPKNVRWDSLPGTFLNQLDDISRMVPGAAKEAARNQAKTTLLRSTFQPTSRVNLGLGGLPQAPSIGSFVVRPPGVYTPFSTALPNASPYAIDYSLRRALRPNVDLAQRLAASTLTPSVSGGSFPFDSVLNRLRGNAQYLTRQAQTTLMGLPNQAKGAFTKLQGIGPTALNPLATRTPTTKLGKLGSAFNPLNPVNAAYTAGGIALNTGIDLLPLNETEKQKLKGFAEGVIYTPGPPSAKVLGGLFMHDFYNPVGPKDELAEIEKSRKLLALAIETGRVPAPEDPDPYLVNAQGKQWAGKRYGFQSPEAFNSLFPKPQAPLNEPSSDLQPLNEATVVPPVAPAVVPPVVTPRVDSNYDLLKEYENNLQKLQGINNANLNLGGSLNANVVPQVAVPEVASQYTTNVNDIPANELYQTARQYVGIDPEYSTALDDLGLAIWAQQYGGQLRGATPELADTLSEKANLVRALLDARQQRLSI